jgi:hypothetical protein
MSFKNRLTNLYPLQPGGTATLTVGTGKNAPTLDQVQLTLGNGGAGVFDTTKINAVRGYMNGKLFWSPGSGSDVIKSMAYQSRDLPSGDTAELLLDFTEMNAKSGVEQYLSSLPLSLLQDLRFEFDIDATASATLTMKAVAHFRAPTANPFVKKKFRTTSGFQTGGEQIVYVPNGPNGGKLVRVLIGESVPGNITQIELRAKNAVGWEQTRGQLENDQRRHYLDPQTGLVVIDFIADGNLAGWFDTSALADVELRLTGTAAATYTIVYEYLDPIGRL